MAEPFATGFETGAQARKAGGRFFATAGGRKGVEGVHFHLVPNQHGRWHFQEGGGPKAETSAAPAPGGAEAIVDRRFE